MKAIKYLNLIFSILIASSTLWARSRTKEMHVLIMPAGYSEYTSNFSEKVLPKSIAPSESSQSVVSKIVDNSLSYWWNNSELKNTSVGRAADTIEKKMKAEVDLGTSGDSKTDHRISFKVMAAQALAKIEYTGWVRAAINYDAKGSKTEAEVYENLSNNKNLIISHSMTSKENKSQLSLRWSW